MVSERALLPPEHAATASIDDRRPRRDGRHDARVGRSWWCSISLAYLDEEAFGQVPARFRQHGYVNDSEFIHHAKARGIDLFSIVFEAQAWEFPAEIVNGTVLALNQLRGAAPATTVGLREFSQNTGPSSWK